MGEQAGRAPRTAPSFPHLHEATTHTLRMSKVLAKISPPEWRPLKKSSRPRWPRLGPILVSPQRCRSEITIDRHGRTLRPWRDRVRRARTHTQLFGGHPRLFPVFCSASLSRRQGIYQLGNTSLLHRLRGIDAGSENLHQHGRLFSRFAVFWLFSPFLQTGVR
jgi:hypothetical protein